MNTIEKDPLYEEMPEGCSMAFCPICKRLFFCNEEHQTCNYCKNGLVYNGKDSGGFPVYNYYEGLDQSKQRTIKN